LRELVPEYRCRLCQLAKVEPEILRDAHVLAVHRGFGAKRLSKEIGERLVAAGHKRPEYRAFGRHTRKHIMAELVPEPGAGLEDKLTLPGAHQLPVEREWAQLWGLYERGASRVAEVDDDPDAFTNAEGKLDSQRLAMWSSAVDRCRALLSELGKLRASERLQEAALHETIRSYATEVATPLGVELRAALQAARRGEHVVDVLADLVEGDGIPTIFRDAAEATAEDVRRRYRVGPGGR